MALNIVTSVVYGNFVFKNRTNKQIVILFYIGLSASRLSRLQFNDEYYLSIPVSC